MEEEERYQIVEKEGTKRAFQVGSALASLSFQFFFAAHLLGTAPFYIVVALEG